MCIFVSFSISALLAKRRTYLYLGGTLFTCLWIMLIFSIFPSKISYDIRLYGGLVLFSLYVLYDTQMLIEKADMGSDDFISHALELFLDFMSIFIRVLIIILKNSKKSGSN